MSSKPMREQVEAYIRDLQHRIVTTLEELDPNAPKFLRDSWLRGENGSGGSGVSCVFSVPASDDDDDAAAAAPEPTTLLEKGGVNISIVNGTLPPGAIRQMRADHTSMPLPEDAPGGLPFFAAGLSLVVHPRNPHAPTVHCNYRYFEITSPTAGAEEEGKLLTWWFGGGADLTPSYLYGEDAVHFHQTLKDACDQHGPSLFPALKRWCDEYFYIPHRGEARGVGGIFFDDLTDADHARIPQPHPRAPGELFALVRTLGDAFLPSYTPLLERRRGTPYTPRQRRWQLLRRGRYVEFNLVYDRGTKFGLLAPEARVESILMSLPETARWEYQSPLGQNAEEEENRLLEVVRKPKDWVTI